MLHEGDKYCFCTAQAKPKLGRTNHSLSYIFNNFSFSLVQGLVFARNRNIFSIVVANEAVRVTWVNILDQHATLLPQFGEEFLIDMCSGPYQVSLASGYGSAYQVEDTIAQQGPGGGYINPQNFHNVAQQMPADIPGYFYDQHMQPGGWDANRFGPFEPFRILVIPEIPSRYRSGQDYKVLMIFWPWLILCSG